MTEEPTTGPDKIETRVRDALAERASHVDLWTVDLSAGAAKRHSRRSARRVTWGGVGALLVAVGVPVALSMPEDAPQSEGSAPVSVRNIYAQGPEIGWVPDGWRPETWRGIELAVPAEWGYGSIVGGCTGEGPDLPVVDRAGSEQPPASCPAGASFGLRFAQVGGGSAEGNVIRPYLTYADGATVDRLVFGEVEVTIVTDSAELNKRVLATIHDAGKIDVNGCPTSVEVPAAGALVTDTARERVRISVCTYEAGVSGPELDVSERLSVIDSAKAREAMATAPGIRSGACAPASGERVVGWFTTEGAVLAWLHMGACTQVDTAEGSRQLTGDLAYWGVSPARTDVEGSRTQ